MSEAPQEEKQGQFTKFREERKAADKVRETLPTLKLRTRTILAIDGTTAVAAGLIADAFSATPDNPGAAPFVTAFLLSFLRPPVWNARNLDVPTQEPDDKVKATVLARRNEGKKLDTRTWVHAMVESARTGMLSKVADPGRAFHQRQQAPKVVETT
jgi:hypothetical protein